MDAELSLKQMQKSWHGSIRAYAIGFLVSLLLTSLSFSIVAFDIVAKGDIKYWISGFALIQATFQLIYFLHLGKEGSPWWETVTFFFMLITLLIVVIGSLWIMYDLNSRMMDFMH
jgi:cytochrome o ubiquinol oxidase operon protein cyoD